MLKTGGKFHQPTRDGDHKMNEGMISTSPFGTIGVHSYLVSRKSG